MCRHFFLCQCIKSFDGYCLYISCKASEFPSPTEDTPNTIARANPFARWTISKVIRGSSDTLAKFRNRLRASELHEKRWTTIGKGAESGCDCRKIGGKKGRKI